MSGGSRYGTHPTPPPAPLHGTAARLPFRPPRLGHTNVLFLRQNFGVLRHLNGAPLLVLRGRGHVCFEGLDPFGEHRQLPIAVRQEVFDLLHLTQTTEADGREEDVSERGWGSREAQEVPLLLPGGGWKKILGTGVQLFFFRGVPPEEGGGGTKKIRANPPPLFLSPPPLLRATLKFQNLREPTPPALTRALFARAPRRHTQ